MNTRIRLNPITSEEEFIELKDSWNELLASSVNPQPFLTWEWMYSWWEVFQKPSNQLQILAIYDDEKLVSIAPFYINNAHFFFKKHLRLIGDGEAKADEVVTHYPDIICLTDYEDIAINMLAVYLKKTKLWKQASFRFLFDNSLLIGLQKKLESFDGVQCSLEQKGHSYIAPLSGTGEEYVNSLSCSTRKQFRSRYKRMKDYGEVKIISAQALDDPAESLDILEKLHRARWEDREKNCIFDSKRFKAFHQKVFERLLPKNEIDIRIMYHAGEPIAVAHNFNYQGGYYSYQSGFKSADDKRFSPMVVFDVLEIQQLTEAGCTHYNYLSTEDEHSYKEKFKCEKVFVYELCWYNSDLRVLTHNLAQQLRSALKVVYYGSKEKMVDARMKKSSTS